MIDRTSPEGPVRGARRGALALGAALFAVAFALAGCSTIKTTADWDPDMDFSRLQTWKWAPHPQVKTGDTTTDTDGLMAERVKKGISRALTQRGYAWAEEGPADFEVAWFVTIEPKTRVTTVNDYHGYGYGGRYYGWGGPGYGSSTTMVDNYNQGTLIIDMRKGGDDGKLFWRGSGSTRLRDQSRDPAKAQVDAHKAIAKILTKFPPPPKKD